MPGKQRCTGKSTECPFMQALDQLGISGFLANKEWSSEKIHLALTHIISRAALISGAGINHRTHRVQECNIGFVQGFTVSVLQLIFYFKTFFRDCV